MVDERLISLLKALQESTDFEQCWQAYRLAMSNIGLTKGNYVAGVKELGGCERLVYLADYDEGYLEAYDALNGKQHDVTLHYCIQAKKSVHWSQNPLLSNLTKEQKQVENLTHDYELFDGFSTPFLNASGELYGGVAVCVESILEKEFNKDILREQAYIEQATRLFQAYSYGLFNYMNTEVDQAFLTSRELEIIKWLAEGKTTAFIADNVLYKSVDSINKSTVSAKKKLNAISGSELVARALYLGLIK